MNKLIINIKYKLAFQLSWLGVALGVYAIVMVLVFYTLLRLGLIGEHEGTLVYRFWALLFAGFVFSARFKEDFDLLLTLSHTRIQVFQAFVFTNILFSLIMGLLATVERAVIDTLNKYLNLHHIIDPFHFIAPYRTDSYWTGFVFFMVLFAFVSSLGLLVGSLFYRFGKRFLVSFWLILSALFVVILPLIIWNLHWQGVLAKYAEISRQFIMGFNVSVSSGLFFLLSAALVAFSYLNIRSLPQR